MNLLLRAANYINRYGPSRVRLEEYLLRKNHPNPDSILETLGYDESAMCDMWIRTFIAEGKSKFVVKQKLFHKKFSKDLIAQKIEQFGAGITDWESISPHIKRRIETLLSRKKSLPHIQLLLQQEYPYFHHEIQEFLLDFSDMDGLQETVQKYKNRYTLTDFVSRQKFLRFLLQKGFRYEDIVREIQHIL